MLSILIAALLMAAPPTETGDDTSAIAPETLQRMTEQSLQSDGLREDSFSSDLWSALIDRTRELIQRRHDVRMFTAKVDALRDEVAEFRKFIEDNEQFGADFASYKAVIEETRRLTEAEHATRRQQERIEKQRRRETSNQQKQADQTRQQQAAATRKRLKALGFSEVGQEVWLSKSAYAYASKTVPEQRVFYQQGPTGSMQPMTTIENRSEIDYTKMTISGSLLNGAQTTRNIGVAFVFRDAHDNQIGQETVIIENARPDVPYPFTGELVMASDRAFVSMTSWVLFADTAPPATTTSSPAPPQTVPQPPTAPTTPPATP